jgi:hypothetical protein
MTRAERLADQEARAQARLEEQRARLAQAKRARQQEDKRVRLQRYVLVGQMADDAGLLALSDADLAVLFQALTPLLTMPDPGAVLTSLLCDNEGPALVSVEGMADLRSCGPCGASGTTVQ